MFAIPNNIGECWLYQSWRFQAANTDERIFLRCLLLFGNATSTASTTPRRNSRGCTNGMIHDITNGCNCNGGLDTKKRFFAIERTDANTAACGKEDGGSCAAGSTHGRRQISDATATASRADDRRVLLLLGAATTGRTDNTRWRRKSKARRGRHTLVNAGTDGRRRPTATSTTTTTTATGNQACRRTDGNGGAGGGIDQRRHAVLGGARTSPKYAKRWLLRLDNV
mmetsp:Transcript_1722/g.3785  ORF Transcript_1722/g.3785 Transcript_1722/m.3785 type:complete len:225 (-) Transcript_1722:1753-2427(-)